MVQKNSAFINKDILRWAREECGFSYQDAVKSDFNPEKLEKVEQGREKLTFKQLLVLAKRYKRPPAFFYLKSKPDEQLIEDFRTIRPSNFQFSPNLREAIVNINEKRTFAAEHQSYDKDYDYSYIKSISITENPENVSKMIINLLKISLDAREKWKNEYNAFNSWKNAIERIGILIFQITEVKVQEMRGFSISESPYPTIALNRSDQPLGRIFTLIHELCHLMLKKGGICRFGVDDEKHFEIERFCNAVAGAVLVPKETLQTMNIVKRHKIDENWDQRELSSLKRIFWASNEVILRRLLIIESTSKEFYQKMRSYWMKLPKTKRSGFGERQYEKILSVNSRNFIEIVLNAMYDKQISMVDVSNYLDLNLKNLKNLEEKLRG